MKLSNQGIVRINCGTTSTLCERALLRAPGESDQRCCNILISSRRQQKGGQVLPVLQVSSASRLTLVLSRERLVVLGTNRSCVLERAQSTF